MTRWALITSDEYFKTYVEGIIVSHKPIKKIRKEMNKFLKEWKEELLLVKEHNNIAPSNNPTTSTADEGIKFIC